MTVDDWTAPKISTKMHKRVEKYALNRGIKTRKAYDQIINFVLDSHGELKKKMKTDEPSTPKNQQKMDSWLKDRS